MAQRIVLLKVRRAPGENVNQELQWLGNSLGLFNLRDRDSSCFRIFITLVRNSKKDAALSSDEIAEKLRLSRGTVVHHLQKLMDAGIVLREHERYLLRDSRMENLVNNLHSDLESIFIEMKTVAKEIDEQLG